MLNLFKRKLEVVLLSERAFLPRRSNSEDAGLDLYSPYSFVLAPWSSKFIELDISIAVPKGFAGFIYARSGIASKFGIRPRNCVGVIDSPYRGCIGIQVENASPEEYAVSRGDRIAQLVIQRVELVSVKEVEQLDTTHRGTGGFGSTGK